MKKYFILILAIAGSIFLTFIYGCQDVGFVEPSPGYVKGHVYEYGSNEPLDSARVFFNPESDSIYTDANGYYLIFGGFPGFKTIHVTKNGYIKDSTEVKIISRDTITQNFTLQKE